MPPMEPLDIEIQKMRDMQQRYKNVFGSAEGRIVLGDILTLGNFGETLNPVEQDKVAYQNFATTIARTAGAFDIIFQQLGMTKEQ